MPATALASPSSPDDRPRDPRALTRVIEALRGDLSPWLWLTANLDHPRVREALWS